MAKPSLRCSRCAQLAEDLIDTGAAARMLGLKVDTLVNWRSNKRYPLPYVKPAPRIVRYCPGCVRTFIESRTESA